MDDHESTYLGRRVILLREPTEEQVCQICGGLVNESQQIICCGRVVCKDCLLKWLKRSKTCPFCRKDNPEYYPDIRNDRAIKNLIAICPFKEEGCKWQGELVYLNDHAKECFLGVKSCPNHCGERIPKAEMDQHLNSQCRKRDYRCQYCGKVDRYEIITGDHCELVCERFPIMCPNVCEAASFPRCELELHLSSCPLQQINCEFSPLGCSEMVYRCYMDNHHSNNVENHITLACRKLVSLLETMEHLESAVNALRQRELPVLIMAPVTFSIPWNHLQGQQWRSSHFSAPSCRHKFMLIVHCRPDMLNSSLKYNTVEGASVYRLSVELVIIRCQDFKFSGTCSLSLISQNTSDSVIKEQCLTDIRPQGNEPIVSFVVSLNPSGRGERDAEQSDILDSLFDANDDGYSSLKTLNEFILNGNIHIKVTIDSIISF